jgi:hypothetical protein
MRNYRPRGKEGLPSHRKRCLKDSRPLRRRSLARPLRLQRAAARVMEFHFYGPVSKETRVA